MLKRVFRSMIIIVITLIVILTHNGRTDDFPDNSELPSSVYAGTHGGRTPFRYNTMLGLKVVKWGERIHAHSIAAAHWDRNGFYDIYALIIKRPGAPWWATMPTQFDHYMNLFRDGCREEAELLEEYRWGTLAPPDQVQWSSYAYIRDRTTGATDVQYNLEGMILIE